MSTAGNWRGPNIINGGLIFYTDAGSPNSYINGIFGNSWKDISGNGNAATLYNGPIFNSATASSIGFDGTNDYAETIRTSTLRPDYVTICAWVKYTGVQAVSFISGYGNTRNNGYYLSVSATLNQFRCFAGNGNNIAGGSPLLNFATLNSNINYVCMTFDGATIRGYINGALGASLNQDVVGPLTYPTSGVSQPILGGLYIGSLEGNLGLSRYWTGNIYQIKIYNRALSAAEIQQNFNATRSRFGV